MEGAKDLNASLRSMGKWKTREKGGKIKSLLHPFGNRAMPIVGVHEMLKMSPRQDAATCESICRQIGFDPMRHYLRVLLECYILGYFFRLHPSWLENLRAGSPNPAHFDQEVAGLRSSYNETVTALNVAGPLLPPLHPKTAN